LSTSASASLNKAMGRESSLHDKNGLSFRDLMQ